MFSQIVPSIKLGVGFKFSWDSQTEVPCLEIKGPRDEAKIAKFTLTTLPKLRDRQGSGER